MPISSGALEWPVTYYSKSEDSKSVDTDEGDISSTKKQKPLEWNPKLARREEYERWRKQMDRKVNCKLNFVSIVQIHKRSLSLESQSGINCTFHSLLG